MTRLVLGMTALAIAALCGCGSATAGPPHDGTGSTGPEARTGSEALTGPEAAGERPADRAGLIRRWVPDAPPNPRHSKPPFVELHADGTWTGSDGCNGLGGTWSAGGSGTWRADEGPSTKIGCDNVALGSWLSKATRATRDGALLVLRDGSGATTGRLRPAR